MNRKKKRILLITGIIITLLLIAGIIFIFSYRTVFIDAAGENKEPVSIYVPTGSNYEQLCDSIFKYNLVTDTILFHKVAKYKSLPGNVKPGHYLIEPGITIYQMVNKFARGLQDPVNVTIYNTRKVSQVAGKVSKQIEADSSAIMELVNNKKFLDSLKISRKTIPYIFIPNTYELYWNTNARNFIHRIQKEYEQFWTKKRRRQADKIGLSPNKVITLASIVQEETNQTEEMDRIAGVYINRLKKGMRLQADPTLKYARDNWSLNRILNKHKSIQSPYNTYKHKGLPPGPISMPEPVTIDKVLNYEDHDYLFFVASIEKPGFHEFSETYREHINKAHKYHRKLNKENIYR